MFDFVGPTREPIEIALHIPTLRDQTIQRRGVRVIQTTVQKGNTESRTETRDFGEILELNLKGNPTSLRESLALSVNLLNVMQGV